MVELRKHDLSKMAYFYGFDERREDYDYLSLVAETKGRPAAMAYVRRLVKSMKEYTRDPVALRQVRDEMARAIEEGSIPVRQ